MVRGTLILVLLAATSASAYDLAPLADLDSCAKTARLSKGKIPMSADVAILQTAVKNVRVSATAESTVRNALIHFADHGSPGEIQAMMEFMGREQGTETLMRRTIANSAKSGSNDLLILMGGKLLSFIKAPK